MIHFGDCLEVMPDKVPDKAVNLILTDLPYGKTRNEWDVIIPFEPMWKEYERVIKDNGAIVLMGDQPFTSRLIMSNEKLFRYSLVWLKTTPTGFLNANKMPLRVHEDILVFYKELPTYNPQKTTGHERKVSTAVHKRACKETENYGKYGLVTYDSTERHPLSVMMFATDKQQDPSFSTQKPVDMFRYLIRTYTNKGDLVLDTCAGSGTTGMAATLEDRDFILIDKGKEQCVLAQKRIDWVKQNKERILLYGLKNVVPRSQSSKGRATGGIFELFF